MSNHLSREHEILLSYLKCNNKTLRMIDNEFWVMDDDKPYALAYNIVIQEITLQDKSY